MRGGGSGIHTLMTEPRIRSAADILLERKAAADRAQRRRVQDALTLIEGKFLTGNDDVVDVSKAEFRGLGNEAVWNKVFDVLKKNGYIVEDTLIYLS